MERGICKRCNAIFVKNVAQRQYCEQCSPYQYGKSARRAMRYKRHRENGRSQPCQVCGFSEVVDLHHEGQDMYWLCPNHHALITRGKKDIESYGIKPMLDIELEKKP